MTQCQSLYQYYVERGEKDTVCRPAPVEVDHTKMQQIRYKEIILESSRGDQIRRLPEKGAQSASRKKKKNREVRKKHSDSEVTRGKKVSGQMAVVETRKTSLPSDLLSLVSFYEEVKNQTIGDVLRERPSLGIKHVSCKSAVAGTGVPRPRKLQPLTEKQATVNPPSVLGIVKPEDRLAPSAPNGLHLPVNYGKHEVNKQPGSQRFRQRLLSVPSESVSMLASLYGSLGQKGTLVRASTCPNLNETLHDVTQMSEISMQARGKVRPRTSPASEETIPFSNETVGKILSRRRVKLTPIKRENSDEAVPSQHTEE